MAYNNEEYVSPHWAGFKSLWWTVAIILFLLILLMWLLGYGCGGDNCQAPVETTVERMVEKPAEVAATIAPAIIATTPAIQTSAASCVFTPNPAETSTTNVVATCTGVETGGRVNIVGMTCGNELNGVVVCEAYQAGSIGNNPTVTTLGASGNIIDSMGDFSLLTSSLLAVDIPAARLYFDISSDTLSANTDNQSLDPIINFLRDNSASVAYVSGFHDPSGNYEFNQDLSKRRAQSVEKLLLDAGISADRIILEKPVETTGSGASKEARRVEVTVKIN